MEGMEMLLLSVDMMAPVLLSPTIYHSTQYSTVQRTSQDRAWRPGQFVKIDGKTIFIFPGMKCLDDCTSVATRNCQISSLYESSQVSVVGLPQQPAESELEVSLVRQLMSEAFGMPIFPSALNLDRVFLTVDQDTREVLLLQTM